MITPEDSGQQLAGVSPNLPRLVEPYMPPISQRQVRSDPAAGVRVDIPTLLLPRRSPRPTRRPPQKDTLARGRGCDAEGEFAGEPDCRARAPIPSPPRPAPHSRRQTHGMRPQRATTSRAAERLSREERRQQEIDARAMAEESKRLAKQAEIDRRNQKAEDERLARVNRAQAIRDAEVAKRDAAVAKEQAAKQAEIDKRHQRKSLMPRTD